MRLNTFRLRAPGARPRIGAMLGTDVLDLANAAKARTRAGGPMVRVPASMRELLALGEGGLDLARTLLEWAQARGGDIDDSVLRPTAEIVFLPPVPDADKFLCVGKNYRSHLDELERNDLLNERPGEPTGFVKYNSCLTGHDTDVVRPEGIVRLDYEPELVFVLGRPALGVRRDRAFEHVVGITLLNDLTCRDLQKREVASGSRFWTGKNIPGFGPLGPCIVTMDEVRDPYDIWVTCSVNGVQRMRVNTGDQIWKLPDILEHFTRFIPFGPGDMFSTGAPGGVAVGKPNAAELFLKPGDVVECTFEDPPLVLRNRIVAPA